MDERYFLEKAQEAEAIADAAISEIHRCFWENVAMDFRRMAHQAAKLRRHERSPWDAAHP